MKRIVLVRHAKASWDDPDEDDLMRPLNQRGRMTAPLMAAWIGEHVGAPHFVWTSPAVRSSETWKLMAPVLGGTPTVETHKALYMANPTTHRDILRLTPDECETVVMVSHQPGVGSFTRKLADGTENGAQSRAYTKFPTAGVAIFEVKKDRWEDVGFGDAKFRTFATPKDII